MGIGVNGSGAEGDAGAWRRERVKGKKKQKRLVQGWDKGNRWCEFDHGIYLTEF